MRQSFDPGPGVSISTLAYEYTPGWQVPEHAHRSDQLIYATQGAMEVAADARLWLIPPQFAVWIPAHMRHAIRMPGAVSMRTLYFRPGIAARRDCAVLHVTPLLRELIVEAVKLGTLKQRNADHAAFRDVIAAQVNKASPVPTSLTMPQDRRALVLAQNAIANLRKNVALAGECRKAGVSVRTMQRIFRREVGIDFETWRRQARLMKAIERLAAGQSVKEVSFAVGYRQSSTFGALFRETFGMTPKSWVAALKV
jgi:AraC-like DNA-binding protein